MGSLTLEFGTFKPSCLAMSIKRLTTTVLFGLPYFRSKQWFLSELIFLRSVVAVKDYLSLVTRLR